MRSGTWALHRGLAEGEASGGEATLVLRTKPSCEYGRMHDIGIAYVCTSAVMQPLTLRMSSSPRSLERRDSGRTGGAAHAASPVEPEDFLGCTTPPRSKMQMHATFPAPGGTCAGCASAPAARRSRDDVWTVDLAVPPSACRRDRGCGSVCSTFLFRCDGAESGSEKVNRFRETAVSAVSKVEVAVSGSHTMRTSPFSAAINRVPGTRPIGTAAAEVRVAVRSQQSWTSPAHKLSLALRCRSAPRKHRPCLLRCWIES